MNLFDTVLDSLNDPSRATQKSDLESLASAFSGGGASSDASQMASLIGGFLKPMLQQEQAVRGAQGVDSFLQSIKQTPTRPISYSRFWAPIEWNKWSDAPNKKPALTRMSILRLLPIVLPAVIGLLQSGRRAAAPPGAAATGATGAGVSAGGQSNPILSQFLDSDGDGDVDMTDLVQVASRFLQR